jgi:hypothetical protein
MRAADVSREVVSRTDSTLRNVSSELSPAKLSFFAVDAIRASEVRYGVSVLLRAQARKHLLHSGI